MTEHKPLNLRLPTPGCYADADRSGLEAADVFDGMTEHLFYTLGKLAPTASRHDLYMALSYAVRDRLMTRYLAGIEAINRTPTRVVAYLSAEFLIGPQLNNNLLMLGIQKEAAEALRRFGINDIDEILDVEEEPGLGNGGLGRLAACFLESLASLQIPATGYGIRYEFGIFDQLIRDGWQVEITDKWLKSGWPWEIPHPDQACFVGFGGRTESYRDDTGRYRVRWIPAEHAIGVPHDVPVLGYRVNTCDRLRLWRADATESFDFYAFNIGDYYGAVEEKVGSETLSKVLYPNDGTDEGRRLRLKQQHFFVSCSLQDMLRLHLREAGTVDGFDRKFVAQLNDTHPAIAVAELMRLLVDEQLVPWDKAWEITRSTFAYTNHTLLPEALETWPEALFKRVLPRHLEIVFEINQRFLDEVRMRFFGDEHRVARMSLIDDANGRSIRMAHLACAGSFAINGVARLHTDLLKSTVLRDFAELWPEKFSNKTNGVTPRRFLALSNPALCRLLTDTLGSGWKRNLDQLHALEDLADDAAFQQDWRAAKQDAKTRFANWLGERVGVTIDPATLFDVQVKRIHEYKRQHLNVLHILSLYCRIKHDPSFAPAPRTFLFGGKAAPGYRMAKLIIKLINSVGEIINRDPEVNGYLRVVFVPDFNVKTAQRIYPAADLSEQISTAGKEASGTGNMKFSMNGALTIGTPDGANVEIREAVGAENFFLFGLTAQEVAETWAAGYHPREIFHQNPQLQAILEVLNSGLFSHGDHALFRPLVDDLLNHDPYLLLKDFQSYLACQEAVSQAWSSPADWDRKSILNVARIGRFSSDRAIREYC
ncbi:MAG: glycogen/starch/alpha-glucan phosphorylase, partial [Synechococcaceae cyanobacterium]|nr:glycogen/starch/alpha-glucan phosphorylase [Synechococcaceae cyanobacterium]